MAVVDAVVRRLPGALSEGSGELESFSAALDGGLEYPHYTRPAEFRGWSVPEILLSGDHGRIDAWRRERVRSPEDEREHERTRRLVPAARRDADAGGVAVAADGVPREQPPAPVQPGPDAWDRELWSADSPRRGRPAEAVQPEEDEDGFHHPLDRVTGRLPRRVRIVVDWVVTIVGAIAIVLAIKAWVVNPYRIPSSSMEPTLHCARPATGCEARFSDRVLANRFIYHFQDPARGDIVVFETTPAVVQKCSAGGTFVKRIVGLPGETVRHTGWSTVESSSTSTGGSSTSRTSSRAGAGSARRRRTACPRASTSSWATTARRRATRGSGAACPRENILGKVFMTYWPPQRISFR